MQPILKKKQALAALLLGILLTFSLLWGCGAPQNQNEASGEENTGPKQEITFDLLKETAVQAVEDADTFIDRDPDYIANFMNATAEDFAAYQVLVTTEGGRIDEYGIFQVKTDDNVADVENIVKDYLQFYKDIWDDRYLAEEYPKLRDAEVKTYGGKYVIFAILEDDSREALFSAVDNLFETQSS